MTTPTVDPGKQPPPARKPGLLQIAKTMFFVLIMIGKKKTWEEGGEAARMTPAQVVAGAIIAGIAVIAVLIGLVKIVLA
jgi:hypothetical protein